MFDFVEHKLTEEQIYEIATLEGLPVMRVAINANGYRQSAKMWPELAEVKDFELDSGTLKIIETLIKQGMNSKGVVGLRSLYEAARKVKPFDGRNGVMKEIKDVIIPTLDKLGYTCLIGDKIYINPRLLDGKQEWIGKVKPLEDEFVVVDFMNEVDESQLKLIREAIRKLKAKEKYILTGK
ncbi:gp73 [Escherichia phage phiEB49]|uniref:Gp73 n=1 Tax=Escherichia phage phiEB49 TaxID=1048207 RepID=F8UBY3_9CAUD|nr:gp73 [Escherichia phage phiEB49]AEI91273.1 gp73 [Escherichia phage phiEB49]